MITTPSMGLKRWDQPNDIFSYTELSDNFNAIDGHDHSTGKGVQIPTNGLANLAVTGPKLANLAVTDAKVNDVSGGKLTAASVTDAKLASPTTPMYKEFHKASAVWSGALSANQPVVFAPQTTAQASPYSGQMQHYYNPNDYTVAGKTLRIRMRAWVVNASFTGGGTWAVFWIATDGIVNSSNQFTTLGATGASVSLAASGAVTASADSAGPPANFFVFAVQNSTAGSGTFNVGAQIQYRHI